MSHITPEQESAQEPHGQDRIEVPPSHREENRQGQMLRNIGLVAQREFITRVRQRSYLIILIIIALIILIATCVPTIVSYFSSRSSSPTGITIIDDAGPIAGMDDTQVQQYLTRVLNGSETGSSSRFTLQNEGIGDLSSAKNAVQSGKTSILLVVNRAANKSLQFTYYTHSAVSDDSNVSQIQNVATQLGTLDKAAQLGLTAQQTANLFTAPTFTVVSTQTNTPDSTQRLTGYLVGLAGLILIMIAITQYGVGVATGIAEEKGSRIMEILVNAATPFQLMSGKILGIGAAGLLQVLVQAIVGIIGFLLQNPLASLLGVSSSSISLTLTASTIPVFVLLVVYFILGFLLYASLYAALGALVQRLDEVQSASGPITVLMMIGYMASIISGVSFATNPVVPVWFRIMEQVPFFTPTMMMMSAGTGVVSSWEIALSLVLLIVTTILCTWIAARIYRYGILMYGQRPSFSQLVKIIRQ